MDVISKKNRSRIMSQIKNKDSKIEVMFRKKLWNAGCRYRKNVLSYLGKPDLVLKKYNIVIFIDSCFWHGCKKHCRLPSTNVEYWKRKIERNRERDKVVNEHYKQINWHIYRIWEHDIIKNADNILRKILYTIDSKKEN